MKSVTSTDATRLTKALLTGGIVAGPFYVLLGLIQMAIRPGFDITRHSLSLLANGDLGWIQTLNFLVTGALLIDRWCSGCEADITVWAGQPMGTAHAWPLWLRSDWCKYLQSGPGSWFSAWYTAGKQPY